MITKLVLKNFQKHKKLSLKLGQITTLVGKSDAGKSAVLRGLIWLMSNKPRGTSFITHGKKECSVGIEIDGHKIVRTRSDKKNEYHLNGERFVSFNDTVPAPIRDLLNIQPVNIQQQHDGVYWLALSPAELSKQMNKVVDLDIIDAAERFEHWTAEVERLSYIPDLIETASTARATQTKITEIQSQTASLRTTVAASQHHNQKAEITAETVAQWQRAHSVAEDLQGVSNDVIKLRQYVADLEWGKLHAADIEVLLIEAHSELQELKDVRDDIRSLKQLKETIAKKGKEAWDHQEEAEYLQSSLDEIQPDFVCPTCGQTLETEMP